MIRARLADEGLEGMFDVYTGGEDGNSDKIQKIGQTLAKLRCTEGVMVGDTQLDVECARHHGLTTVAVTYGWVSPERVLAAKPDYRVDDPRDLEDRLRQILGM
jgi:phosphoglycolate phosphatase